MRRSPIGNTALISALNHRLVLQAVRAMQPTFRADIARRTGLKPATVTSIVNRLLRRQLLRQTLIRHAAAASSTNSTSEDLRAGRPPVMLELNADVARIIAIDLDPLHVRVAVTDFMGNVKKIREQRIDPLGEPGPAMKVMLRFAREMLRSVPSQKLLGVGVSVPGMLDYSTGTLLGTPYMPNWNNVPIGSLLRSALSLPVHVERAVHLAALYETRLNPDQQDLTTLVLWLRAGVRMSIVHRGRITRSGNGLWGEIGHCVIDIDGPPCVCGGRGCLDAFVGSAAIVQRGRELLLLGERGQPLASRVNGDARQITPELILELASNGDQACAQIVRDVGRYLGIAVAGMVNVLAPDQVIISGMTESSRHMQPLLEAVQQQVDAQALPRTRQACTVRVAEVNDRRALLGAAALVAQQFFELPDIHQHA